MPLLANTLRALTILSLLGVGTAAPADDEAETRRGAWDRKLEAYDADGDGELSPEERSAARAARGGRGQGARRGPKAWDTDGDGSVSDAERAAGREERRKKRRDQLQKYDADGDGRLSRSEREAARADGARLGPARGHRGQGGGPGGRPAPDDLPQSD